MITRSSQVAVEVREKMRGAEGSAKLYMFKEHVPANLRIIGTIVLGIGDGIGKHDHTNETEIYYIISGEGVADDNGTEVVLKAGDAMFTGGGAYHSIRNEKLEPLVFFAVIVRD